MSQENVEVVRARFAALERCDCWTGLSPLFHPKSF